MLVDYCNQRRHQPGSIPFIVAIHPYHYTTVVIRRLMAELEKAKLVRATAGRSGGFELERGAEGITLQDIYQAVEDATVFRMHKTDPNSKCPVACQMGKILGAPLRAAESALSTSLARTTLKDVAEAVH